MYFFRPLFILCLFSSYLEAQPIVQRIFTTADGLPTTAINGAYTSSEGFLWLLTNSGLVQYDGTQFRTYQPINLKSADFLGVVQSDTQNHWIWSNQDLLLQSHGQLSIIRQFQKGDRFGLMNGLFKSRKGIGVYTEKGILHITKDGEIRSFIPLSIQPLAVLEDLQNRLWWVDENGNLWIRKGEKHRRVWGKFAMGEVSKIKLLKNGSIDIESENGRFTYSNTGNWRQHSANINQKILQQIEQWRLIQRTDDSIELWHGKTKIELPHPVSVDLNPFLIKTQDGSVWYADIRYGLIQFFTKQLYTRFQGEGIWSIQSAPDNSFWVVQDGIGVLHDQKGNTKTYSIDNGLSSNYAWGVLPRKNGEVWMGLDNGLMRLNKGKLESIGKAFGLPADDFKAFSLYESPKNNFYVGATRLSPDEKLWGAYQWTGKRFVPIFNPESSVSALLESADGALWIGTYNKGLWRYHKGQATHFPQTHTMHITALYQDQAQHLFVGTNYHGLGIIQQDQIRFLGTQNGLYENKIWAILEDEKGYLWTSGERGISTFSKQEALNATVTDKIAAVGFSAMQGVSGHSCSGGSQPVATKDQKGNLYFPCVDGVTVVPSRLNLHRYSPQIISVESDHQVHAYHPQLRLDASERHLKFNYTALNFTHSQNITLFYCLDDGSGCTNWKASSTNFVASYANLGAGTYTFRVKNSEAQEARLQVTIPPFFYETWWFRLLLLLGIFAFLYFLYRFRLQRETERKYQAQLETDIEKATTALKAAEARKSLFIQGLSHDFKTPLTTIKTPIEGKLALHKKEQGITFPVQDVQMMWESTKRLERYVEDFLMLAKAESGLMPTLIHKTQESIGGIIAQVSEAFKPQFHQKQLSLSVQNNVHQKIAIDLSAFERILLNLLSNAYKFTPMGGEISISTQIEAPNLYLQIKDSGLGISESELPHLFERFYTGQGNERIGTGLGLTICKVLVELHQGKIWASSKIGQGTTFHIQIPIDATATVDIPVSETTLDIIPTVSNLPAPHHLHTLLIVEDDDVLQSYLSTLLSPYYNLLTAWDGAHALEILETHTPDLILSDVMMSPMDGLTLCQTLKSNTKWEHIPIILLSARDSVERQLEGFDVGAEDYIAKPFNQDILLYRIERWLLWKTKMGSTALDTTDFVYDLTLPAHNEDRDWLMQCINLIEQHLSDADFEVNDLASHLFMHSKTLDRRIKSLLGKEMSTAQLIRHIRLSQSASQLLQTRHTIAQIARQVGYLNVDYFRKLFKSKYQLSPDEYRKEKGERPQK